jgi:hypothetical protein
LYKKLENLIMLIKNTFIIINDFNNYKIYISQ